MKTLATTCAAACAAFILTAPHAQAHVSITVTNDQRCITSDGVPSHDTGPWRAGAVLVAQSHQFCMPAAPQLSGGVTQDVLVSGITVSGIPLRPGTAEYYDASSPRGYSRDRASGWNVEGMGGLTMDAQNGHVDGRGLYHYHGIPKDGTRDLDQNLFGYAADGFPILYAGDHIQPSWQLKSGARPSGPSNPGGAYDGTYVQDYEFVAGSGQLDECNGAMVNGAYVYFATDTFPFFPRCFKGTVSADFMGRRR
ncbi:YHYH protein [Pseudooctadecabacter jejudonensis]|uniref:YHYH domain-containing protein n=1 Tax=Pseudooctadecabacter jejudonensis TaxID=1391910 RepID=A0A1Y5TCI9_9RHOB|nr:YHYH protein [Pseudooctadecabacter jejudonensis]SLN60834.1 hypothetical protein PSJ8397_03249 [Pseudooctadecabacter jejudonensis]